MITLLIVLASIGAYIAVGAAIAKRRLPTMWESARRNWSLERSQRDSAAAQLVVMWLFWPVVLPVVGFASFARGAVQSGDPKRLQEENDDLRRQIAELERETGIGR